MAGRARSLHRTDSPLLEEATNNLDHDLRRSIMATLANNYIPGSIVIAKNGIDNNTCYDGIIELV